jgi:hypothetical protein
MAKKSASRKRASKKARKKSAASRKKRMGKPVRRARRAAAKPAAKSAARRARKPLTHKPAPPRKSDLDATFNALMLLVLIMIVLGSTWFYMQHQPARLAMAGPSIGMAEKK